MREILFRGKQKCIGGKWVEGCLLFDYEQNEAYIAESFEDRSAYIREVIPETVGQYTGLTDKNGKKIFEGDICSKFSNYSGKKICFPIVFEQGLFYAKYSETAGMPLCDICEKIEIIGNIHDNPELLKGGVQE